jgi:hypothetical protein
MYLPASDGFDFLAVPASSSTSASPRSFEKTWLRANHIMRTSLVSGFLAQLRGAVNQGATSPLTLAALQQLFPLQAIRHAFLTAARPLTWTSMVWRTSTEYCSSNEAVSMVANTRPLLSALFPPYLRMFVRHHHGFLPYLLHSPKRTPGTDTGHRIGPNRVNGTT